MKRTILLPAATLAACFAATALAYTEKKVEKGAALKGVVRYAGDMAKANGTDASDKDADACGKEHQKPELVVDPKTKALRDAVVYLKKVETGKSWTDEQKHVVLDQKKCVFEWHVVLVAAGGEVVFKNSDTCLHNVSVTAVQNPTFNESVGPGKEISKRFEKPEFVKLACSVHPWMNATIVVMAHPYYSVTDEKGEFSLADIPAGRYAVVVQHQELGKADKRGLDIELAEGETKTQDFELGK